MDIEQNQPSRGVLKKRWLSRPYPFKFFKGYLPQTLLCPFWNTLSQVLIQAMMALIPYDNLDIGSMGAFSGAHFFEKRAFACLHPLNRCHFHFQQFLTRIFFAKLTAQNWWDNPTQRSSRIGLAKDFIWSILEHFVPFVLPKILRRRFLTCCYGDFGKRFSWEA